VLGAAGLVLALGGCTGGPTASAPLATQPNLVSNPPATTRATPAAVWAAPSNAMELTRAAGLQPETKEFLEFHVHAHLDIFLDGQPVLVPSGIGINIQDPGVTTFPESDGSFSYGGVRTPCASPCISPLHTHWTFGVLHTESATTVPNTLGQFFIQWAVKLTETCVGEHCSPLESVAFYVNGKPYAGDPTAIELADKTEIAIVIGTPPAVIPSTGNFSTD
jgi:hypothetical protein